MRQMTAHATIIAASIAYFMPFFLCFVTVITFLYAKSFPEIPIYRCLNKFFVLKLMLI